MTKNKELGPKEVKNYQKKNVNFSDCFSSEIFLIANSFQTQIWIIESIIQ